MTIFVGETSRWGMDSDQYTSIAAPTEGLFKDKGSRFIAFALPVSGEEEVKEAVDQARKKYHDARHVCYAYRLGADDQKWRANDDGEPSGSAGRPILGQIDSYGLSDILIIVVRYFGGIKLGIPGLINAYRSAAADALSRAQIIEKTVCLTLTATFPYEKMGEVMKLAKAPRGTGGKPGVGPGGGLGGRPSGGGPGGGQAAKGDSIRVLNLEMDTPCRITLSVPLSQVPIIRQNPWLSFEE